jgi:hypothetical protein
LGGNDLLRDSHERTDEKDAAALPEISAAYFASFSLESQNYPVRCGPSEPDISEHDHPWVWCANIALRHFVIPEGGRLKIIEHNSNELENN